MTSSFEPFNWIIGHIPKLKNIVIDDWNFTIQAEHIGGKNSLISFALLLKCLICMLQPDPSILQMLDLFVKCSSNCAKLHDLLLIISCRLCILFLGCHSVKYLDLHHAVSLPLCFLLWIHLVLTSIFSDLTTSA